MQIREKEIIRILLIVIIILSFSLFSHLFTPVLQSDHALNVLMAYDFDYKTIYCWGQDRGGTLVPALGFVIHKLFSISPLTAVSLVYYLILTLGFWGYSTLIKNKSLLIPFGIAWFIPFQRFIEITSFPIGMSYCIFGIGLLFIRKIDFNISFLSKKNCFPVFAVCTLIFLACWTSDLAFVSLTISGIVLSLYTFKYYRQKTPISFLILYWIALISVYLALNWLKKYATGKTEMFQSLNTLNEVFSGLSKTKTQISKVLFTGDSLLLFGAWVVGIALLFILFFFIKNLRQFLSKSAFVLNLLYFDFFGILTVLFLSHWVYLNELGRWYFVAVYISGTLIFFILLDQSTRFKKSKFPITILSLILLLTGLSNVSESVRYFKKYKPATSTIKELNALGNIGIIGEYWNSFIFSIVDPEKIKSVENETNETRREQRIIEVLDQEKLYLVKDNWLDSLPKKTIQFGCYLTRVGEPFRIANSTFCQYQANPNFTLDSEVLFFNNAELKDGIAEINPNGNKYFYAVYGPYLTLTKGKYKIKLFGTFLPDQLKEIVLDIYSNEINTSVLYEKLNTLSYNKSEGCYEGILTLEKGIRKVELRLLSLQLLPFTFSKYEIEKQLNSY